MENKVNHRRGLTLASNGGSSNNNNNSGGRSNNDNGDDPDYELVRLKKKRSWSPNGDDDHRDDDADHHDGDDDFDTTLALTTPDRDEDEEAAASEISSEAAAAAPEAALPTRFYISTVLTLLSLIAYILTLKLGSGVVRLKGIGDLNMSGSATSASSSSASATVLVGLTGFVRVLDDDMDIDINTTDGNSDKPWKGGGYTVQQQSLFVNSDSNAKFQRGRTVWFMWLVLGVALPWVVSLASNTDTDIQDDDNDVVEAATDTDANANANDSSMSKSSSTRNSKSTSTRNCGRNFQLITASLCLVAAVIPVFSVHCILESRLCQGSFIELQSSLATSSSASASSSYYFPTDATVHERAQASCVPTTTASTTTSSAVAAEAVSFENLFSNNYFLILVASGLWAIVGVAMLVLALRPNRVSSSRKFPGGVPGNGADVGLVVPKTTSSRTSSSNGNGNDHQEESESKLDTIAPQHRMTERITVVALFLTLLVLALYMALIPYWLGGSGLLQVSLAENNDSSLHNVTHTTVILGTTTWNPPQDIVYTAEQQDMVDDTFFVANTMSCIPLLAVMTVYLLVSLSVVLDSSSSKVRVTAVAATAAGIGAVASWMIPATVLRSDDFCRSHTYYEFGFLPEQDETATAAMNNPTDTNNSTRGLGEQETSDLMFWKATDITRHDDVSVDCALYWPGHVLMWGAFGMTLVTGLLLWNIYSITLASGGPMYRELSRQEERDANNSNNDDEVDDTDDDVEMVEYPREEGTHEIV